MPTIEPGFTETEFHALTNAEKLAIVKSLDANVEALQASIDARDVVIAELNERLKQREEQFVAGFDQLRADRQNDRLTVGKLWNGEHYGLTTVVWSEEEQADVEAEVVVSEATVRAILEWAETFGIRKG